MQIGTPEEIWRRPADTFVARALGQPEINLLDGVVDDGRIRLGGRRRFDVPMPAGRDRASAATGCGSDCGPATFMSRVRQRARARLGAAP